MLVEIVENFKNDKMKTPEYAHVGDSGVDLQANVTEKVKLSFGERKLIPTGISVGLPQTFEYEDFNWELQIRPRSGLAHKHGITVLNTPGTIDSIYTGEIFVNLINLGKFVYEINPGDKIAQAVLCKARRINFDKVDVLTTTERGANGHGSTDDK